MESLSVGDVWVHAGIGVGRSAIEGRGLFARNDLDPGTVVIRLSGRLVSSADLAELIAATGTDPEAPYVDTISIEDDTHLVISAGTIVHYGNHSCDPTLWHVGPYDIATRRMVRAGEELTVDYGTNSAADGFRMECSCGSATCRGIITSVDWRRAELQDRYGEHWTPVLRARIAGDR